MAAPKPVVKASQLPESVCDKDERVQIDPKTSPPYNWICSLQMEDTSGDHWRGSGFKIHLPGVNFTAVVTSAHCVYMGGAYARRVTVTFPGQAPVNATDRDLYATPEYINSGSADHDYGLILLPGNSDEGFGYSTELTDGELNKRIVTNCGYPGDKPLNTLWITGGEIERHTDFRIFYMNDTAGGQSGSPVYTWYGGYWTVIGVHSYGGCPNSAPRFTTQMISRFMRRMNILKTLRSVETPTIYVRCDARGVDDHDPDGDGVVNCQHEPPSEYERFCIFPSTIAPSLAIQETLHRTVIESGFKENVFVRTDGKGMDAPSNNGGGVVNCQFGAGPWENYFIKEEDSDFECLR